ncbi:hypothetical protein [Aquihabitans sp. McL0605]|uniref:hypothetical protein n=1 Tax=Aquihabitans sp. McL0605 TaxID=3415671 RepID=UPI003CFABE9D
MKLRPERAGADPMGLVGWVFADLMLALVVVFLATQPGDPRAGAEPKPQATTTTSTTTTAPPTTTTTKPQAPPSVDANYICIRVQTNPGQVTAGSAEVDRVAAEVQQKLEAVGLKDRRAGIVLIFGVAGDPGPGKRYAQLFNDLVIPKVSGPFVGSARRLFWGSGKGQFADGSIELNIYPLVGPGEPRLPAASEC